MPRTHTPIDGVTEDPRDEEQEESWWYHSQQQQSLRHCNRARTTPIESHKDKSADHDTIKDAEAANRPAAPRRTELLRLLDRLAESLPEAHLLAGTIRGLWDMVAEGEDRLHVIDRGTYRSAILSDVGAFVRHFCYVVMRLRSAPCFKIFISLSLSDQSASISKECL